MKKIEELKKYLAEWQEYGDSEVEIEGVDGFDDAVCTLLQIGVAQPTSIPEVLTVLQVPDTARDGISIESLRLLIEDFTNMNQGIDFVLNSLGSELVDFEDEDLDVFLRLNALSERFKEESRKHGDDDAGVEN